MSPAARRAARWVWFPLEVVVRFLLRNGKRIAVTVAGAVLLLAGLVMMVTPGPGLLLIIAGLAVLATEYVWAERALNLAKERTRQAKDKLAGRVKEFAAEPGDGPGPDPSD